MTRELTPSPIIQSISLYYFIVTLSVDGLVQSFHKGLSEGLRCSLNQPTCASREKYTILLVAKGFIAFFQRRRAGEKQNVDPWSNTATCRPQKPERHKAERKSILSGGFSRRGLDSVDAEVEGECP